MLKIESRPWPLFASIGFLLLVIFGLAVWWPSPIYPDELAFRMANTRFIHDGWKHTGLYPFCTNNMSPTPWFFIPALWLLSISDTFFSAPLFRLISAGSVILCSCAISFHTVKNGRYYAGALLGLLVIGVAGSGLILARGEHLIILHIFFIIVAMQQFHRVSYPLKFILVALLLISTTITSLIHPQGLLFLPLTGLTVYGLFLININGIRAKLIFLAVICILIIYLFFTGLRHHQFSCDNFPELVKVIDSMVLDVDKTTISELGNILFKKIRNYINVFLYQPQYQVLYLPGVPLTSYFMIINFFIILAIICSLVLNTTLMIYYCCLLAFKISAKQLHRNYIELLIGIFLTIISWFLIIYDLNQYFYRTFFINFLLTISTIIFLAHVLSPSFRFLYFFLTILYLFSIFSMYLNYKTFYHRLSSWDAIATTPKKYLINPLSDDLNVVAQKCGVSGDLGGLAVDAYTYELLKHSKNLVNIYYLRLAADAGTVDPAVIARSYGLSGVLASCKGMEDSKVGWPADVYSNKICCTNLHNSRNKLLINP